MPLSSASLSTRPMRPGEEALLAGLFTCSVHILGAPHYDAAQRAAWAPQPPDMAFWRARFSGLRTLVAKCNGEVAGFLSHTAEGHIDLLFTAPAQARKGVASALLIKAVASLAASGALSVFTEASLVARPFFARHGFVVTGEECVARRGSWLPRLRMEREIRGK